MLTKITDGFYIDIDDISYVDKKGKEVHLKVKSCSDKVIISVYQKEWKELVKVLQVYCDVGEDE